MNSFFCIILFTFVFIQVTVHQSYCKRLFFRGRLWGGNLAISNANDHNLPLPEAEYFEQPLDHFNGQNKKTWSQRFFRNDKFISNTTNFPVFLMIGGEGPLNPIWSTTGTWIDYAKTFKALCFQLEHRYYGKSHPTSDLSTKNLQWLTSQQALADIANFITSQNKKLPGPTRKWIVFGGSYPGSLAAWARLKYPHLIHAAVSTSGPLLALLDFADYFKVVRNDLEETKEGCSEEVAQSFRDLQVLLASQEGRKVFRNVFNVCEDVVFDSKNVSNIFETLSSNFAGVAQYNKDNRAFEGAKDANVTLDVVCEVMTNTNLNPIDRLSQFNKMLLTLTNQSCLNVSYNSQIEELSKNAWSDEGSRQWTYQTCMEFGFFQTSSHPFGDFFPADFFIEQCKDIFGSDFNRSFVLSAIDRTNAFYGGLDIQVDRTVFVHGSVDPWHALGITETLRETAPAIYIKGTAHCANMYPADKQDSPQLRMARRQIQKLIRLWLQVP